MVISAIACEICGASPMDGHTALVRQNEKGVPGIWRCTTHNRKIDPVIDPLIATIEAASKKKH